MFKENMEVLLWVAKSMREVPGLLYMFTATGTPNTWHCGHPGHGQPGFPRTHPALRRRGPHIGAALENILGKKLEEKAE